MSAHGQVTRLSPCCLRALDKFCEEVGRRHVGEAALDPEVPEWAREEHLAKKRRWRLGWNAAMEHVETVLHDMVRGVIKVPS